jgi:hypothetical protein
MLPCDLSKFSSKLAIGPLILGNEWSYVESLLSYSRFQVMLLCSWGRWHAASFFSAQGCAPVANLRGDQAISSSPLNCLLSKFSADPMFRGKSKLLMVVSFRTSATELQLILCSPLAYLSLREPAYSSHDASEV